MLEVLRSRAGRVAVSVTTIPLLLVVVLFAAAAWTMRHRPFDEATFSGETEGPIRLRYTGVAGFELFDGETTVLLDPVVTRPTLWKMFAGPIVPDTALSAKTFPRADYILLHHAHYDHAADAPEIAARTGATVLGSKSVGNLLRSRGIPESQIVEVRAGQTLQLGSFSVTVEPREHGPVMGLENPMSGTIAADAGPLWWWQYTNDGAFGYLLESQGTKVLFSTQDGKKPTPADVVLSMEPATISEDRWRLLRSSGARVVIPSHFDNFFQPRGRGLSLVPGMAALVNPVLAASREFGTHLLILDYDQVVRLPAGR